MFLIAVLAGLTLHHTVAIHVAERGHGRPVAEPASRAWVLDADLPKIEVMVIGRAGQAVRKPIV